jgi:lysophospholipase L1-like esterase
LAGFLPSVTGSATSGESPTLGFEFGVNGDDFAIGFAGTAFNIQVNGGPVATYTAVQNLGELYFRVKFNSSANRLIHVEGMGLEVVELLTPNTNGIVRRSVANTRILFIGDSKVNGANGVNPQDTWVMDYVKVHPNVDVWEDAVGGTGLINSGSYTNYQGRIFSDFTNNYSAYFVCASVNDGSYPSNQIYSAASLLFQTIKSNAPSAFIGCVLPVDAGTPISAGVTNSTYAIRKACLDNAVPFIDPGGSGTNLPPGANPWITGNYNIAGNGNAYLYVSSDGVHPSLAGHNFIEQNIDDFVTASVFPTINPLNANLTGTFTGNGGGLTNLSPQNVTAINLPVNGYALRYTNGVFYWAP